MMTQTPVPQLIGKLAVPTIISMLVTGIYNTADTFFVAKISTEATAAVGLVFSVMAIIQALGFFCGHGSGNCLSRFLGAGRKDDAVWIASSGFCFALLIGLFLAIVGQFVIDPLAYLIGASEATISDVRIYMRIILIGAPFMIGQFVINNQLRFQGSAMVAMIGLMCGAVMNMVLDPLLIFGFHMGVAGAAVATVSGQIISFFVLLVGSMRGENLRFTPSRIRFNGQFFFEIINGGIPSLFRQSLAAVSTMLLNTAAGHYGGDAAIAGMSIATRTLMLLISALIGFGQGYQPVCSFNYGAGKCDRVREGYFFCVKVSTVFLIGIAAVCFIFAEAVVGAFRSDPAVVAVGKTALRCQTMVLPLSGTIVITNMMLQSIGKGVQASITAAARNGIFFIPLILILPRLFGLFGVEITQSVADLLSMALAVPFAVVELRKMKEEA